MDIGLVLPQTGPDATREHVSAFATTAEQSGYASLWVSDHVVFPREFTSRYPYAADGRLPARFQSDIELLEPLTLLAFVAAITERVQIGTAVMVLPMRHPVLHAKVIASLDRLAGGRFVFGVGVGWCREEFEVLSASFERRGARVDEQITLMRALWSGEEVTHHGEFYDVDGWICRPTPPRPIPLWIGGARPPALRRAGRLGDGWIAGAHRLPTFPEDVVAVRRAAEDAGRDPDALTFGMVNLPSLAPGREEQTANILREAGERGVEHIRLGVEASAGQSAELIGGFARDYLDDLHEV